MRQVTMIEDDSLDDSDEVIYMVHLDETVAFTDREAALQYALSLMRGPVQEAEIIALTPDPGRISVIDGGKA